MDISYLTNGCRFNYRVSGLWLHNNYLLLCSIGSLNYWFPPGGRVKLNEKAENALKREFLEELSTDPGETKLMCMVESFFTESSSKENYHEIGLYYMVNPAPCTITEDTQPFVRTDNEGQEILFKWHPISKLNSIDLRPPFVATLAKNPHANSNFFTDDRSFGV